MTKMMPFLVLLVTGAQSRLGAQTNTKLSNITLTQDGCTSSDTSFEYYLFVQQWPPAQASTSWPSDAVVDDFTIHGMWPSRTGNASSSYPCKCTSETFDASELASIRNTLNAHWPSYTGDNEGFWTHEWSKHGTCSSTLSSQLSYFSDGLSIRKGLGLLDHLEAHGVNANGGAYTKEAIIAAFSSTPVLGCKSSGALSEIAFCFDKSSPPQQIDCDSSVFADLGEFNDCSESEIVFTAADAPASGLCAVYGCSGYDPDHPCQCNSACDDHDDCCDDYDTVCK